MRVGDEARDALGRPGGAQHASPFLQTARSLRGGRQTFEALIQHPLDRALRDAEIARAETLIKPADALLACNLHYRRIDGAPANGRRPRRGLHRRRRRRCCCCSCLQVVRGGELQARLDDPDRVRRGAGGDARDGGGAEVHVGVFASAVEPVGDDLLSVSVREEVYRARGDDADECGHETLE